MKYAVCVCVCVCVCARVCVCVRVHSVMSDSWTIAHQASLSMGFPRQELWRGLSFLSPEDLPYPGIEHTSPSVQADSLLLNYGGSPHEVR